MTDKYCVIGNPIAHSKSPEIHPVYARQTGQDLVYERCLAPLDGFAATVKQLVADGYRGANVTLPFKLEAARVCTRLEERAGAAGAVNTLVFANGEIVGDNTDGPGLVADITRNAGVAIAGKRVLLLGAGGAARGALLPLIQQGPREIVIANRTVATAEALARDFGNYAVPVSGMGFASVDGSFDIVINASASSLAGELPPLSPTVFGPGALALDMMYGSQPTVFMEFASQAGASVRDGLGMLIEQAAEAFAIWRSVRPDTAEVFRKMRP
ncbi:shikimate dehydrogenase [Massilia sp. IC2-477]|uniref:shikimate dehydrogenase n=1 Tax=Massilia sp. IC2-477 TaxID=2887198 RepID=UPI001D10B50D|nr:shikimate dehydrogenase [Massilia sp. IC2-477]MCC2956700.1 shikimate dehydrogenase [Massilia sp. IC2-477]